MLYQSQTTPALNPTLAYQQQYQTAMGMNGMYTPQLTANSANLMLASPASASSTSNTNETFEQKWARIQAAKKTNPFAEDIAKKFEIKL